MIRQNSIPICIIIIFQGKRLFKWNKSPLIPLPRRNPGFANSSTCYNLIFHYQIFKVLGPQTSQFYVQRSGQSDLVSIQSRLGHATALWSICVCITVIWLSQGAWYTMSWLNEPQLRFCSTFFSLFLLSIIAGCVIAYQMSVRCQFAWLVMQWIAVLQLQWHNSRSLWDVSADSCYGMLVNCVMCRNLIRLHSVVWQKISNVEACYHLVLMIDKNWWDLLLVLAYLLTLYRQ